MPNGQFVSLRRIDDAHNTIDTAQREKLSELVMRALPRSEVEKLEMWIGNTIKVRPIPPDYRQLMTFLALGDHAIVRGEPVVQVVEEIVQRRSAVGILFPASAA